MKRCFLFAIPIVFLLVTLPSSAPKKHVDITLRGPWILYVDSSKSFANWSVLIAMAPGVHDPTNPWAHQAPTVSNGEAYVLDDPNESYPPTSSQIYCLIFDTTCARQGVNVLDPDDYPAPNPVEAFISGGQTSWDWATASRQYYAPTLILSVPDSYSANTAWPMRFGPKFDAQGKGYKYDMSYSTGVVLHYTNGPTWFGLKGCPNGITTPTPTPNPTVKNCTNALSIGHTTLANTGALQIEMGAPATNWSCDPHVRRVYPQMLRLIGAPGTGPNADWAVIDPAHYSNDDGSGVYDVYPSGYTSPRPNANNPVRSVYCLEHDSQGQYNDSRWGGPSEGNPEKEHTEPKCKGANNSVDPWIGCVQQIVAALNGADLDKLCEAESNHEIKADCERKREVLLEIRADGTDLRFPRVSQLRRLDDNMTFLGQLKTDTREKKQPADLSLPTVLLNVLEVLPNSLPIDPYSKTHGDCGAPVIHLANK
jgi:hypothetical protein